MKRMTVQSAAARLLVLAALAVSLAACATTDPAVDIVNGRTRDGASLPVTRTSLDVVGAGQAPAGTELGMESRARAAQPPPGSSEGLGPDRPWLGEIGLRHSIMSRTEVGIGFAVPNSYADGFRAREPQDRARSLGVGVWWKFEF